MLRGSENTKATKLIGRSLVFATLSMFSLTTPAQAQNGEIVGEKGGRYFEFSCGPGKVLVGLRGSAGVIIDNMQAICARVEEAGRLADPAPLGPVVGHARPEDRRVQCPAGFAVSGASVGRSNDHPYLVAIDLSCTELVSRNDGGQTTLQFRGSGNLYGYSGSFGVNAEPGKMTGSTSCLETYAVGIRGRADEYISAFGLICGSAVAERTLNLRKKPTLNLGKRPGESTSSSIPGKEGTLNKRRRPVESNPVQQGEPPVGASVFTDSNFAPPPAEKANQSASPSSMIGGVYVTTVAVTDTQCVRQNFNGSAQQVLDIRPQPGIVIPLNDFSPLFGGPVTLNVEGLRLSQSTSFPLVAGQLTTQVPASFDGVFSEDGSRFDVQFKAGTDLCRISGTIAGVRN